MNTLLHICCAPCANQPIALLREEGIGVTGFWYNPNIHPYTEYQARKRTLEEYAKEISILATVFGRKIFRVLPAVFGVFSTNSVDVRDVFAGNTCRTSLFSSD